jgi:hypothetical protein
MDASNAAARQAALLNSIYRETAEEEYYEDLWNEIQEEEWKASICQEWICKELGEDLIIWDDYEPEPEQDWEYEEVLDHYRSIEAAEWAAELD